MFTRFCLPILTILLMAPACHGLEVTAVLSSPAQPYATALQAFSRHLQALPPLQDSNGSHRDITIRPIILSGEEHPDALRIKQGEKPQDLPPMRTERVILKINPTMIDKLGLTLQEGQP